MKMCFGIPRCPSLNSNGAWGFVSAERHSFGRISTDMLWIVNSSERRSKDYVVAYGYSLSKCASLSAMRTSPITTRLLLVVDC